MKQLRIKLNIQMEHFPPYLHSWNIADGVNRPLSCKVTYMYMYMYMYCCISLEGAV